MANEAIGLIETKGIVPAVEALDAALKAANVTFVEQHKVGSGLVAITLKGDVNVTGNLISTRQHLAHRANQFRLANRFHQFSSLRNPLRQFQNLFEGSITEKNALVAADHGHALDHAGEDCRRLIALVSQRTNGFCELRYCGVQRIGEIFEFVAMSVALQRRKISAGGALSELLYPVDARGKEKRINRKNREGQNHNCNCRKEQGLPDDRKRIGGDLCRNKPIETSKDQEHQRQVGQTEPPG